MLIEPHRVTRTFAAARRLLGDVHCDKGTEALDGAAGAFTAQQSRAWLEPLKPSKTIQPVHDDGQANQAVEGMAVNDKVKMVLIAAVAAVACVGIYQYFSPYQSCVRAHEVIGSARASATCAHYLGSKG